MTGRKQAVITPNEWIIKVLTELGISTARVVRVVIDSTVNEPIRIHVMRLGTENILDVPPLSRDFVEIVDSDT